MSDQALREAIAHCRDLVGWLQEAPLEIGAASHLARAREIGLVCDAAERACEPSERERRLVEAGDELARLLKVRRNIFYMRQDDDDALAAWHALTEPAATVCKCGDYRHQHPNDGPCSICAAGRAPWDNCAGYRPACDDGGERG